MLTAMRRVGSRSSFRRSTTATTSLAFRDALSRVGYLKLHICRQDAVSPVL